jgi:hypothetical protein
MSFKKWEEALRFEQELKAAQIEWEHARDVAKADLKRAEKHVKAMKKARGQMFRPDPPIRYIVTVDLLVRPFGAWAGETPTKMQFIISGVMSETQAEVQAIGKAKELGFLWAGTLGTKLVKS